MGSLVVHKPQEYANDHPNQNSNWLNSRVEGQVWEKSVVQLYGRDS